VTLHFTPRPLSAAEYVRASALPSKTMSRSSFEIVLGIARTQTIVVADVAASGAFQSWLANQNRDGADVSLE